MKTKRDPKQHDNKMFKIKNFFNDNDVIFRVKNHAIGHFQVWNPFSDSWIHYYATTDKVCDSVGSPIGKINYTKFAKFSMKDKEVKY